MRQSKLFTKTQKNPPKDEVSLNAQLLIRGGFINKEMAGVYSLLPLGLMVYKKIEQIIREEMNNIGGQELFLPTLHPKENWEKTGRWDSMDDLFKLPIGGNKELVMGPTHEEIISPLAKKIITSYKDLPKYLYQFQNKFRNELRAKSGLLRGREFVMKDLYSFHANEEDLEDYYTKAMKSYKQIFKRCGIDSETYLTYASGGSFSKYSHEYQTLTQAGEDLIYICENCNIAINKEILDDQKNKCPECGNSELQEEKAVEVGNIFKLKTKFSIPFDLNYTDENGEKRAVIMGCYGIGLQRLIGTIVEVHNDSFGIKWPDEVAPYKVHLISLKQDKEADELYGKLKEKSIETLYDDRDVSPGNKLNDAELIGCPYRLVLSEKTLKEDSVEVKKRNEKDFELVEIKKVVDLLK